MARWSPSTRSLEVHAEVLLVWHGLEAMTLVIRFGQIRGSAAEVGILEDGGLVSGRPEQRGQSVSSS